MILEWKEKNPGKTTLSKINSSKKLIKAKIRELVDEKGATEIFNPKESDLENFNKGVLISYVTKDGKYRSGGFLTNYDDKYFVLLGGGGFGPRISFSVQFKNVKAIYVRKPNKKNVDQPIKPTETTHYKTEYPVEIDGVVVYYARDNWDKRRFMNTKKYRNMLKYVKNQ